MGEKSIVPGKGIEITIGPKEKGITISPEKLEISLEGKPISAEVKEIGFVYLVVDCSTSMGEGDKLNQAKRGALNFAKDALAKDYLTGLIKFESSTTHLCEPTQKISVLDQHLEKMWASGSTNMVEAIQLTDQKLKNKKGTRVMVVVTDGEPNGPGDPEASLEAGKKAKGEGIDIITIGTDDANWEFLKKLASRAELGIKVSREQFEKGITSTAKTLPQLGPGKKGR